MSGYSVLLAAHGYWRWVVLGAWLWVLTRSVFGLSTSRAWTKADDRAATIFVSTLDIQFLLGLILYFGFSPFFQAVRQAFAASMKNPEARFFGIEHETAMFFAVAAVHILRVRARRATEARAKHRAMLLATLVFGVLAAWAIPWPGRPALGRPLFRSF
jgi:hypothetical protein